VNVEIARITPCYTIAFDRRSGHPAKRLWSAITDAAEISRWMDYPAHVELRPGGDYRIDFSRTDDGALDGVIVRVEPERLLTYVWGLSVCEWKLADMAGGGCTFQFVHHGQVDSGDGEEGLAAGWHEFLDRLDLHLNGRYIPVDQQKAAWERLKPFDRLAVDGISELRSHDCPPSARDIRRAPAVTTAPAGPGNASDLQLPRSARVTGIRAALSAGSNPPTAPSASAHPRPVPTSCGDNLNAKATCAPDAPLNVDVA
jgi:uncharacterized protein YndB with AHSA1/START domain